MSTQEADSSETESDSVMEDCAVNYTDKTTLEVLSLFVPRNSSLWEERTQAWYVFFYLMLVIYCFFFLFLALSCILLLVKRHLAQRFRVKTFIAIDLALVILGLSRFLFLILDPWGQSGFCKHFACIVFSRLLGSLGFPSLTASYTLVFITLWISGRIHLGTSWVQRIKILIPLCCIHYVAAIVVEIVIIIPLRSTMATLILLVICEAVFAVWGFLVCAMFFVAGFRLLKTMEETERSSSVICKDSPNISRHDLIAKSKLQNNSPSRVRTPSLGTIKMKKMMKDKKKRAVRKITLIMYITVVLGMLYSLLSIVNIILFCLSLFDGCIGEIKGQSRHPEVWLVFRYIFFTLEVCMGFLLTYAISDYAPVVNALKNITVRCCKNKALVFSSDIESSVTTGGIKRVYEMSNTGELSSVCTVSAMPSPARTPVTGNAGRHLSPLSVSFSADCTINTN